MRVLVDHLYAMPATDPRHRYMLVETADECRHVMMFGEFIRCAGTPGYRASRRNRLLGSFMKSSFGRALGYHDADPRRRASSSHRRDFISALGGLALGLACALRAEVKALRIDGALPGEVGYVLHG